jgi:hypothetical protein
MVAVADLLLALCLAVYGRDEAPRDSESHDR